MVPTMVGKNESFDDDTASVTQTLWEKMSKATNAGTVFLNEEVFVLAEASANQLALIRMNE